MVLPFERFEALKRDACFILQKHVKIVIIVGTYFSDIKSDCDKNLNKLKYDELCLNIHAACNYC